MKQTMKKSLWLRLGLALALFIAVYGSLGISASAQPPLPHAFYGTVEIAGQPAPAGTKVEARSGGTYILPDMGNPVTTTEAGKYGGSGPLDGKLYVQGDLADGDELEFYVNEMEAQCYVDGAWVDTFPYEEGGVTELNLRTEAAEPTPGSSSTPQPTPTPTSSPATSTPASTSTPGPSSTPTSAPATSTPASTSTPGPSPTPASTSTPGPSPTSTATPQPATPGPSPTPASTSTPGPSPTPASTSTPGPSPTSAVTSKPSTPGPSPTSAPVLSPTPITTPGGESEGPSALLWIAIVALVGLGGAAIAFGIWGLKRREAE